MLFKKNFLELHLLNLFHQRLGLYLLFLSHPSPVSKWFQVVQLLGVSSIVISDGLLRRRRVLQIYFLIWVLRT
jgi:hypothetical protein